MGRKVNCQNFGSCLRAPGVSQGISRGVAIKVPPRIVDLSGVTGVSPAPDPSKVFVVIPTYNEGRVLANTVWGLLPHGYSVVVVDDGSSDGSVHGLSQMPVAYLRHPVNLGQGAALETGV